MEKAFQGPQRWDILEAPPEATEAGPKVYLSRYQDLLPLPLAPGRTGMAVVIPGTWVIPATSQEGLGSLRWELAPGVLKARGREEKGLRMRVWRTGSPSDRWVLEAAKQDGGQKRVLQDHDLERWGRLLPACRTGVWRAGVGGWKSLALRSGEMGVSRGTACRN